jgi:transposase
VATEPAAGTDPEVVERTSRRRFTAKYKLRVLEQADGCTESGQIGALLRREGLYSSHLTTWRRQREAGAFAGLAPRKRGHKANPENRQTQRMAELERENERLRHQLVQAETIIDVQKKSPAYWGFP